MSDEQVLTRLTIKKAVFPDLYSTLVDLPLRLRASYLLKCAANGLQSKQPGPPQSAQPASPPPPVVPTHGGVTISPSGQHQDYGDSIMEMLAQASAKR